MKIDRDVLNSLSIYSLIITLTAISSMGIVIAVKAQLPELPPLPPLIPEEEDFQQSQQQQGGNLSSALDSQQSQQQGGNLSFAQVYRDYVNSVVGIILPTSVSFNLNPVFDGTGFVYAKEGRILYVITPAHVISGYEAEKVNVAFPDGSTYEASVQGSDPRTDIAVLELKHNATQERSVEPIRLGNSSAVVVGEEVLAVGNPFLAGGQTLPNLATRGIVGAAGVEAFGAAGNSIIGAIVTDAPGAGGSSGSPVFNSRGEVLGMVTSGDEGQQCCSYAVPANILRKVADSLIETTFYDFPWIGITPSTLTTADILAYGLPRGIEGVKVLLVDRNGPAHKAGIDATIVNKFGEEELGDIITAIDGNVISSADQFHLYIEENTSVGDTINLSVFRNGNIMHIPVTIG